MGGRKVTLGLKVPVSLRKYLEKSSKENCRSMSQELSFLINEAAKNLDGELDEKAGMQNMTFLFPVETYENLQKIARQNHRSASREIYNLIDEAAKKIDGELDKNAQ